MADERRFPSIFDEIIERMRREMRQGFPFYSGGKEEDYRDPLGDITRIFDEDFSENFEKFVKEDETPSGKVKKFGPIVYGFSYSKKPGEEPEIQEFGNVRPTGRGKLSPSPEGEREPLIEVVDLNGKYEVTVEMPGVEKDEIDLSVSKEKMSVKTTGDRKYRKNIKFEKPVKPEKVEATFRNGILTLEIEKEEKDEKKGRKIDIK